MSKKTSIENIKSNIEHLQKVSLDILSLKNPNVQAYPNHTPEDIKSLVDDTLRVLIGLYENENLLQDLSFDQINGIQKTLNTFVAQFKPLESIKNEQLRNQHHNPLNQLKNLNNTLRQYGVYSILTPSVDIPLIEQQLKDLSGQAAVIVKEATDNAKIIRDLIPDATATSLSTSLRDRAKKLRWRVNLWLAFVICILITSSIYSYEFLSIDNKSEKSSSEISSTKESPQQLTDTLNFNNKLLNNKASSEEKKEGATVKTDNDSFVFWLKRIIVFLPIFYLIVFSIRQYNKERKLLEIYTHKEAIAQTLPAYMEQSTDESIKSEILLRGSTMVFTLPENPDTPIQGTDGVAVNELKSLLQIKNEIK